MTLKYPFQTLSIIAVCLWGVSLSSAQEWTRFRGPNGTGIGEAKNLPDKWEKQDFLWEAKLPGTGHASPVVWGEKLFVTCADDKTGTRRVVCLSTVDGKLIWSQDFTSTTHKKHQKNSFATSTAAVDEKHVYVCWGTPNEFIFMALNHAGEQVWKRDLGPFVGGHGSGASPIVFEDLVILPNDKDKDNYLLAVDRMTGVDRWKLTRNGRRASYSTPCIYQPAGEPPLAIFTDWEQGITGVDARTGEKKWEIDLFGHDETKRAIGSPVIADQLVIATCGFTTATKLAVAVRPNAAGDAVQEVYRLDRSVPHIPTPLVYNNLLFLWADNGIVSCVDAATGESHWQKRLGGVFSSSPVCADQKLYGVSEDGDVHILRASKEFEELGSNSLAEGSRSTPAFAGGKLFIRTFSHVYCIGPRTQK